MAKLVVPIICITAFYNLPGLLWFIAVPLASYDVLLVTFHLLMLLQGYRRNSNLECKCIFRLYL
jgi:hypothetical protein